VGAELHRVCLGQALGRDAAFVAVAATDVTQFNPGTAIPRPAFGWY
jgi:hypothetical protein